MAIVQSVAERMRRKSFGGPTIDRQPDGECSLIDPISCVSRVRPNNKPASIAVNGAPWNASSTISHGGINAIISSPIHSFVKLFLFKEIFSFSLLFYSKDESAFYSSKCSGHERADLNPGSSSIRINSSFPFLSLFLNCITAAIFPLFSYHAGPFVTIINLV